MPPGKSSKSYGEVDIFVALCVAYFNRRVFYHLEYCLLQVTRSVFTSV
jgi:hypothetical protein